MVRGIFGRIACIGGKHERSFKDVKQSPDDRHTSVCEFCRVPMIRRGKRDWIVAGKA